MFSRNQLENMLFLDIETASLAPQYEALPERIREHWDKKTEILNRRAQDFSTPDELFPQKAAIFSEFGKVVCISCGILRFEGDQPTIRLKSYFGPDEKKILADFSEMLNGYMVKPDRNLCAHNGKEFDFPFLGRRYVINSLPIPKSLAVQGKKPWETNFVDTMELWKFGDYKSYTGLDLLCAILEVPSPKDDMDGSQVGTAFWQDEAHDKIRIYCEKDVLATAQVVLRFAREQLIEEKDVHSATSA